MNNFEHYQILFNQLDVTKYDIDLEFQNECARFRRYVEEWFRLQRAENTVNPKDSISNSGSRKSHSLSRSSSQYTNISSLRVRQEQERAELIEKQKSLQRKQQLEKDKLEMKLKEERLELETQMAVAEAKAKILDKELSDRNSCRSAIKAESPEPSRVVPVSTPAANNSNSENATNFNRDLILSLKRPQITVNKFGGEPTEFTKFMRQFNCSVLIYCDTWEDKINSLDFYTYGEANKIVSGLSYLDAEQAFKLAVQELTERYGDSEVIATAYIEKALKWQQIKSDSPKTLDSFGIFLTECLYAVRNIDAVQILNYSENIKVIASKLPFGLHDKWRSIVRRTQKTSDRHVSFEQLVEFVREEAKKSNDPIFGREAMNAVTSKSNQQSGSSNKYQSNRSQSQSKTTKSKNFTASVEPCCQHCNGNHFLNDCEKLSKLTRSEVLELISKDKLCFGCLKPGHQRFKCWNKLTCSKCNRKHPTILHSDQLQNSGGKTMPKSEDTVKVLTSTEAGATNAMRCTMPVVPVKVVNGCKILDTYAFTDVGSSVCFVTDSLKDKLGVHGKNTQMTLQTMNGSKSICTTIVNGIQVFSYDMTDSIVIPTCYAVDQIPVTKDDIPKRTDVSQYPHLSDIFIPELAGEIGLIIGNNIPEAYCPKEYRIGSRGAPHASKTAIGWILWNVMREEGELMRCASSRILANRIGMYSDYEQLKNLDRLIRNVMNFDFPERDIDDKKENSALDEQFLTKVKNSVTLTDGHYQIGLPFGDAGVVLPKNYRMASDRLESLKRKLNKNENFAKDYIKFMNTLFECSYAEEVTGQEINSDSDKLWYIPHHGVYHKQKGKLRIVFDCSAKFRGVSLNDTLLSGPDLSNNLLGVLLRFRLDKIAVMADIEGMFHQVKVPPHERCSLRFLWWPDGDISLQPKHYQMTAHLFGAVSSPSCANFALKITASDNTDKFAENITNSVMNDFYVDDLLKSMDCSELEASRIVQELIDLCKLGGFRLHKWISNNDSVLESIPDSERANVKQCSLFEDDPVVERALGLLWDVNSDSLTFQINLGNKPCTRRGILSIVSAVYDPLGLVSPALLPAKSLLQELCQSGYGWDDRINERFSSLWSNWLTELPLLQTLEIPRCVKPVSFGDVVSTQLHHFSDASEVGYGVASYLRLIDNNGVINCSLIMGKSRVAPLKKITIPRMELTAATVATRISKKLIDELRFPIDQTYFWTDSTTVLRYISNCATRFKTFVANRVSVIREATSIKQWKYISTKENPADISSRGIPVKSLMKDSQWFQGPSFLSKDESCWPNGEIPHDMALSADNLTEDPEAKRLVNVLLPDYELEHPLHRLIRYFSGWRRLVRAVAIWKKFTRRLLLKSQSNDVKSSLSNFQITCHDIEEAKLLIIKHEQSTYLPELIKVCSEETQVNNLKLLKSYKVSKLDPCMVNGVLRVGGRLNRANGDLDFKNPIIITKHSILSTLIIRDAHQSVGHLGKNATLAKIRKTFWIIGGSTLIKSILSKCVACRKYNANKLQQKMADLPAERLISGEPPFYRTGIDYFGPFEVKRARSIVKRYGVIFTCMNSRAVHLEISTSLDTDSCINAVRRFISRRGTPRCIRSDNGTNLVGANRELKQCIDGWNKDKLTKEFTQKGIHWEFNPPSASHFGGVWERLIRIIRKVLYSLQQDQLSRLDDESLQTLMCEVEQILNNRPITKVADTPDDLEALTPSHLLNPGYQSHYSPTITEKADGYLKRRWRQVQYLTDIFWKRWTHEYLPCLQERQKWLFPKRNISVNDIVLVVDSKIRNSWALARVISVISDKNGLSRIATVKTKGGILQRPITKLSLILECDEFSSRIIKDLKIYSVC